MIHLGFKTSGKFSAGDVEANKTCYNDVGTKGVFACDPGKPARHRQVLPGARFAEPGVSIAAWQAASQQALTKRELERGMRNNMTLRSHHSLMACGVWR